MKTTQTEHQNREERGFKWLWTWNGCWCRRTALSISETADLLGFSHTTISSVYREWSEKEKISSERQLCGWTCLVDVRGQRRMDRLVRDDRKTTVTQITTRYNQDLQNTISEHTTHRTLKQMDSSSRRPHRVPLRSDKNSTRRIQFTQTHQNWTIEDCKTWWVSISAATFRCRVRIWCKEHESMDHPALSQRFRCWWCNGVGGIFLAHFGSFSTNWALFKHHSLVLLNMSIPLWLQCTHLLMYFQQDNAPCHKDQIISDWFLEHDDEFTFLKWPPQSTDLNPIEHLWDVEEREILIMDVQTTNLQQLCDAIMSIWTKISEECFQHLVESMPWRIKAVLKAKADPTRS